MLPQTRSRNPIAICLDPLALHDLELFPPPILGFSRTSLSNKTTTQLSSSRLLQNPPLGALTKTAIKLSLSLSLSLMCDPKHAPICLITTRL